MVITEFVWGANLDFAAEDIRDQIKLYRSYLPKDADDPMVLKFSFAQMPIIMFGVTGDMPGFALKKLIEDDVAPRLERVDGVASARVFGSEHTGDPGPDRQERARRPESIARKGPDGPGHGEHQPPRRATSPNAIRSICSGRSANTTPSTTSGTRSSARRRRAGSSTSRTSPTSSTGRRTSGRSAGFRGKRAPS